MHQQYKANMAEKEKLDAQGAHSIARQQQPDAQMQSPPLKSILKPPVDQQAFQKAVAEEVARHLITPGTRQHIAWATGVDPEAPGERPAVKKRSRDELRTTGGFNFSLDGMGSPRELRAASRQQQQQQADAERDEQRHIPQQQQLQQQRVQQQPQEPPPPPPPPPQNDEEEEEENLTNSVVVDGHVIVKTQDFIAQMNTLAEMFPDTDAGNKQLKATLNRLAIEYDRRDYSRTLALLNLTEYQRNDVRTLSCDLYTFPLDA